MQRFRRDRALVAFVVVGLIVFSFMFLVNKNTITNVSAVEVYGVGVYWDSDCRDVVSSIDWGTLEPGSVKNVIVYIRNEVEEPVILLMSTMNWNPSRASEYITISWNYSGRSINPDEVLQVTKTLSISSSIEGISNFGFDIVVTQSFPGDLNFDRIINIYDVLIALMAYGSYPGHPKWNPLADINDDDIVNIFDVNLVIRNYGKTL